MSTRWYITEDHRGNFIFLLLQRRNVWCVAASSGFTRCINFSTRKSSSALTFNHRRDNSISPGMPQSVTWRVTYLPRNIAPHSIFQCHRSAQKKTNRKGNLRTEGIKLQLLTCINLTLQPSRKLQEYSISKTSLEALKPAAATSLIISQEINWVYILYKASNFHSCAKVLLDYEVYCTCLQIFFVQYSLFFLNIITLNCIYRTMCVMYTNY